MIAPFRDPFAASDRIAGMAGPYKKVFDGFSFCLRKFNRSNTNLFFDAAEGVWLCRVGIQADG